MNDLVDTTEMYLRTIYDLEEEGVVPLRARIAERLEQSGPTVSQTVSRMERDGLLHVAGDRHLELTDKGRALAVAVMRKHRLAGAPPGVVGLGVSSGARGEDVSLVRLTELPVGMPVAVVVRQLTEHVQGDTDLISRLKDAGVVPNARVTVEANDQGGVLIVIPGHEQVELPHQMAHAVKVEKV